MKKSIILFFMVLALLMTSTVPALALGNDYTFSSEWYNAVLSQTRGNLTYRYYQSGSYQTENVSFLGGTVSTCFVNHSGSGIFGGLDFPNIPQFVYIHDTNTNDISSSNGWEWLAFTSPVNITVKPGQSINFQSMILIPEVSSSINYDTYKDLTTTTRLILDDGSIVSLGSDSVTKLYSPESDLGTLKLNSSGDSVIGFDADVTGESVTLIVNWTNNTDDTIVVSSINNNFSSRYLTTKSVISQYYYGFFSNNTAEVVLPSYVEENLYNISMQLKEQNSNLINIFSQLDDVRAQLDALIRINDLSYTDSSSQLTDIRDKLDDIIESSFMSGAMTGDYLKAIIIPQQDAIDTAEELTQKVESAKEELQELKIITESVKVPTSEDVLSGTTPDDIQLTIDDALTNSDVNNVLSSLFNNSIVVTMLLSTISIGAVGYIFFGKKG